MQFPELIEARPQVMMGKPRLKGTRIPVYLILEKLAAGETSEDILGAYPQLRPEYIEATLAYAAGLVADEDRPRKPVKLFLDENLSPQRFR